MADFCRQCWEDVSLDKEEEYNSIFNFYLHTGDLEGLCKEGETIQVLCEGCGNTFVDHTGKCVYNKCLERHNT